MLKMMIATFIVYCLVISLEFLTYPDTFHIFSYLVPQYYMEDTIILISKKRKQSHTKVINLPKASLLVLSASMNTNLTT